MDTQSALEQAKLAIESGDKSGARAIVLKIIYQEPRNEEAYLLLADTIEEKESRIKCLKQVLDINPDNFQAQQSLEQLQVPETVLATPATQPRTEQGGMVLAASVEKRVKIPTPSHAQDVQVDNLEKALAAVQDNPKQANAWLALGDLLQSMGNLDKAKECYRRARVLASSEPEKPTPRVTEPQPASSPQEAACQKAAQAAHYFYNGDYVRAQALFEEALALWPKFADAHDSLGLCLVHRGQLDKAVAQWERGLECDPNHMDLRQNLALGLHNQGLKLLKAHNGDEALPILERAVSLYRELPDDRQDPDKLMQMEDLVGGARILTMTTGIQPAAPGRSSAAMFPVHDLLRTPQQELEKNQLDLYPANATAVPSDSWTTKVAPYPNDTPAKGPSFFAKSLAMITASKIAITILGVLGAFILDVGIFSAIGFLSAHSKGVSVNPGEIIGSTIGYAWFEFGFLGYIILAIRSGYFVKVFKWALSVFLSCNPMMWIVALVAWTMGTGTPLVLFGFIGPIALVIAILLPKNSIRA